MAKKRALKGTLSPPSSQSSPVRGRGRGRGRGGIQQTNSPTSTTKNNNKGKSPEPFVNNKDDVTDDVSKTGKFVPSSQISDPNRNPDAQADDERNEEVTEINKSDQTGNNVDGAQIPGVSRVEEGNRGETGIQVAPSQISDPIRNPGEEVTEINKSDRTGNNADGAPIPGVSRVEEKNRGDAGIPVTDVQNSDNIVGDTEEDGAGAETKDKHVKGTEHYDDGAKKPDYPRAVLHRKKNILTDNSGMQLVRVDGIFDEIEGHKVWKTESMSH